MSKSRKTVLLRFFIINFSALIIGVLYGKIAEYFILSNPDFEICAFKELLHFYCPGCGGSRSVIALINFDFLSSFIYYPPTLLCVLLIIIMDIFDCIAFLKNQKSFFCFNLFYLVPIAIVLQFFVRNILLLFGIDIPGDILL